MTNKQATGKWEMFAFGGISSCVAETATMPFDVVKVRMQLQGKEKIYKNTIDALVKIQRNEGFKSLFLGLSPACFRQITYGTLRFGFYGQFRDMITKDSEFTLQKRIFCGFLSGICASFIANPTDLIKVRMQGEMKQSNSQRQYKGILSTFSKIHKNEGLKGLYRGAGICAARGGIISACELATYDHIKTFVIQNGHMKDGILAHFCSSFIAGGISAVCSMPLDVVKSRVMNQPVLNGKGTLYSSGYDCFVKTVKNEGVRALWKGLVPFYSRNCPHVVITFVVMEQIINFSRFLRGEN